MAHNMGKYRTSYLQINCDKKSLPLVTLVVRITKSTFLSSCWERSRRKEPSAKVHPPRKTTRTTLHSYCPVFNTEELAGVFDRCFPYQTFSWLFEDWEKKIVSSFDLGFGKAIFLDNSFQFWSNHIFWSIHQLWNDEQRIEKMGEGGSWDPKS